MATIYCPERGFSLEVPEITTLLPLHDGYIKPCNGSGKNEAITSLEEFEQHEDDLWNSLPKPTIK